MSRLILITASRDTTPALVETLERAVLWVQDQRAELLVGEAPGGDAVVRRACELLGMAPYVFGARGQFRQPEINAGREHRRVIQAGYYARDRLMGMQCSLCVAVMRAPQTPGTYYTGTYVESLGKKVYWRILS